MIGLLASEARKLTSVRTVWVLSVAGWGFVLLAAALTVFTETGPAGEFTGQPEQVANVVDSLGQSMPFVLVVGLLIMTTEFSHQTAGRTFLVTPSRPRILLAKLLTGVGFAVWFMLGGLAVVAVVLLAGSLGSDVSLRFDADVWLAARDATAGTILNVLFGVAVGSAIRSQVVAITGVLVWMLVLENLVSFGLPSIGRWLPFSALSAVFTSPGVDTGPFTPLDPQVGLAVFLGWVVLALLLAWGLLTRRDV